MLKSEKWPWDSPAELLMSTAMPSNVIFYCFEIHCSATDVAQCNSIIFVQILLICHITRYTAEHFQNCNLHYNTSSPFDYHWFLANWAPDVGRWTVGPQTVGPRGPTVHFFGTDSWTPDIWAPGPNCPGPIRLEPLLRLNWCGSGWWTYQPNTILWCQSMGQSKAMLQVTPPGDQVCNQCKWRHLVVKFVTIG